MLRQDRGGWRTGQRSELGTAHWLTNGYAWWQHASWWWTRNELLLGILVQWMSLIVSKDLEHDRLRLQVLNERLCNGHSNLFRIEKVN